MSLPITLPDTFVFDQSSLQDFADCPRRFYLRYIRQLRYPAPESAPIRDFEAYIEHDAQFHRLAHQHTLGIQEDVLEATITNDTVGAWWDAYLEHAPPDLPARLIPEVTLSAPLAGHRLYAKFDLLAFNTDHAVIVEWKTTPERLKRAELQRRLQTAVYPYLLAAAGAHLNSGEPIAPETISMVYWFAEFPQKPEVFTYSAKQYKTDYTRLEALAEDILQRGGEADFELTDNFERCQFCAYRSLNDRGAQAGDLLGAGSDITTGDFTIDLHIDQIAETGL